jgi:hypothetical protein
MTYKIETQFDDGDALFQDVFVNGSLVGAIWTDGEGLGSNARAMSNICGYWAADAQHYESLDSALRGLLFQAQFERDAQMLGYFAKIVKAR